MKRRFRNFLRSGWYEAEIPRANLYRWEDDPEWGNRRHYKEIREWCEQTFAPGPWESTLHGDTGTTRPGVKRFAFQHESDRTMFVLKWHE